jgi:D-glycero-D-manno-heptose 1,7-bisphosphate phosphatase
MNRAVFLDRDGTINSEVGYLSGKDQIQILDGVPEALNLFKESGFLNIIITNQSGIARGYYTEKELEEIHLEFMNILRKNGKLLIDGIYYSPYHPEGTVEKFTRISNCRKPGTGMIEAAVKNHNIDLRKSFLIGDSLADMQCAENAGIRKILVLTGYGKKTAEECKKTGIIPDFTAENIGDAAEYILSKKE